MSDEMSQFGVFQVVGLYLSQKPLLAMKFQIPPKLELQSKRRWQSSTIGDRKKRQNSAQVQYIGIALRNLPDHITKIPENTTRD